MKTSHILSASALALALAGCGGGSDSADNGGGNGGGGNGGGNNNGGGGSTTLPTSLLQGLWQSPAGASPVISAIVLPDGKMWAVATAEGQVRVLKAGLSGQTAGFTGRGKSYLLGTSTVTDGSVAASVVEKSSLTGSVTPDGGAAEPFSLAYQARYETAATLSQFAGAWRDVQGPGAQNWNITTGGALTGTRTTGCTYAGQLSERPERKAVVDVTMTEDCGGTRVRLHGVATLNTANGISMVLATESESAAVALTLSR